MILDHEFPPDIRVEKEIQSLAEQGYEVHIACFTRIGKPLYEKKENFTIHRKAISDFYYKSSVGALKFPFYFNFWRQFIHKLFAEYQFNVVHVHDLPLAMVGYEMKQKYDVRFVLDLHENWPALLKISDHTQTFAGRLLSSEKKWRSYEIQMADAADFLVVVAPEMRERMKHTGVKNRSFYVVPNTLELNSYNEFIRTPIEGKFILYYAGGLTYHRGIQVVLKAMAKLPINLPIDLLIIGTGKYQQKLKELSEKLNISERVNFLGWLNQGKVYEYLFRCDVALIPHLKTEHTDNTSPNKIFQYMQAGIPVLSSNCNYLERIINECQSGLVYEDDKPDDLAIKILKLYIDRNLCDELGKNGLNAVKEKYNWVNTVTPLLQLYKIIEYERV